MFVRSDDVRLALAAYNVGPGRVDRAGGVPAIRETEAYNVGPGRVDRAGGVPAIRETEAYVDSVIDCFLALTAGRTPRRLSECRSAPTGRTRTSAAHPAEDAARSPLFVTRSR